MQACMCAAERSDAHLFVVVTWIRLKVLEHFEFLPEDYDVVKWDLGGGRRCGRRPSFVVFPVLWL